MPSATVHLKIAYMMKNEIGIKNEAEFYMGAIAPDSVNLDGYASEQERYSAHIRSKNYAEWKENIKRFYDEEKVRFIGNEDFLKGYIFHLYTDIAWDETVQPNLFRFLRAQGFAEEKFKEQKWRELFRLNYVLAKQDWYGEAREKLKNAVFFETAGVTAELMKKYRDYILGDYEKDKMISEPPIYLNEDFILAAALRATEYFDENIE